MSKHEKYTRLKRQIGLCLAMGVALFSAAPMAFAATSVVANTTVPTGGHFVHGGNNTTGIVTNGTQVNVTQNQQNAVITWKDFSVGGSGVVNFDYTGKNNFNTLNYVTGNNISQIYGTINAVHDGYAGNIYIVNPSGVQIGNSAQINVGSLYVSNAKLGDDLLNSIAQTTDINQFMKKHQDLRTDAELMSLGNINATNVTFEGNGHIVIDTERIKDMEGKEKLGYQKIQITTNDKDNIVVGYKAYDEENKTYKDANIGGNGNEIATVNGNAFYKNDGYMWVEDVEQLQAINTNLGGNYALRNSIDATGTAQNSFISIGNTDAFSGNTDAFSGKFDGIKYNIFGLTITGTDNNAGLFAQTDGATINNVTLVGGSITSGSNVGAIVGNAANTTLTNVVNSAAITGKDNVGGIIGSSTNSVITDAVNTGTITGTGYNVGGLIGSMTGDSQDKSQLIGNSYNLGNVSSTGANVGGLVGYAVNSTIGDGTNLVYNVLDVTGAYNVGGIVGNMEGSTVQNAENSGNVKAEKYTEGSYSYHTGITDQNNIPNISGGNLESNGSSSDYVATVKVNTANVGGIAGMSTKNSKIENVVNTGNVSSYTASSTQKFEDGTEKEYLYYTGGNVGGIVGMAVDTNINTAVNRENTIRGAHNVGGIAGYFGNTQTQRYEVSGSTNDGGDIMATGARQGYDTFVRERVRRIVAGSDEAFIVGNIGGIVGYMDGDNVFITQGANRGTVHSQDVDDFNHVLDVSKAANVGGIVGKVDRNSTNDLDTIQKDTSKAAISSSFNTGDVRGYTAIGGIAGMMYHGEIAKSYNLGYLRSTRQSSVGGSGSIIDALNMGGIVGDTTENAGITATIYDVYNKGQIGDAEFNYFGRHIGGIVGRLNGTVEKAYNTGAIYNGYNVVGGIAGYMHGGKVNNSFNTGNITVYNKNNTTSQVGGIVGSANGGGNVVINNVYNLGTLRSFDLKYSGASSEHGNAIGGILGTATQSGSVIINNAYTTGNIYAGKKNNDGTFSDDSSNEKVGSIYGSKEYGAEVEVGSYTYYIEPAIDENRNPLFSKVKNNANESLSFDEKDDVRKYNFTDGITSPDTSTGDVDKNSAWRIYDGNTPILNVFLPDSENYFSSLREEGLSDKGITSVQYGTAYDPLLTIVHSKNDLEFDFGTNDDQLSITDAAGLAIYGGGLTLNGFNTENRFFGGIIYSDGALTINSADNTDINLGSASELYGSSVTINAKDNALTIYGSVTATGNTANGAEDDGGTIEVNNPRNIKINAGEVDIYGKLTSAQQGQYVTIAGIQSEAVEWTPGDVDNPYASMTDLGDRFAHKTGKSAASGDITIMAARKTDEKGSEISSGDVNIHYGNKGEGLITSGKDLTVEADGDVFVDSDLFVAGNMSLTSKGKDGEVLLTLTNIGKVQADRVTSIIESAINGIDINEGNKDTLKDAILQAVGAAEGITHEFGEKEADAVVNALIKNVEGGKTKVEALDMLNNEISVEYMHEFMHSFNKETDNYIALNADSGDAKLTVDMWVENADGTGKFDFEKYDSSIESGNKHTFVYELNNLAFFVNTDLASDTHAKAPEYVYVEVRNGEQLQGIQNYVTASGVENHEKALGFNYALMGDINASGIENYEAIGGEKGFTGTFDGRGNRIIGLDTTKPTDSGLANAGIFSQIGKGGTVKNVNIYSGNFSGTSAAGAVAGTNSGTIENVTTFGNTVTVNGNGNAGGIVGSNTGTVDDVEAIGSVIANNGATGGLVGTNEGAINNSYSNSAVTGTANGLGGVVGVNNGDVQYVDSLGVTKGSDTGSSNIGGIIGINNGNMYSGYNESIVSGNDNVGGIIGTNAEDKNVENVVNATSVTGKDENDRSENVGGLIGVNKGNVTNGRNNGTITGTDNVGGLVGNNADKSSVLTNLVNDSSAEITGISNVGGIAGNNEGTITTGKADDENEKANLINRGSITGHTNVGGVAGINNGTIENANNDVELNVNPDIMGDARFFGGIAGVNTGTITNATNTANVNADGATYVGGIVGKNDGHLKDMAGNSGNVTGEDYVGGVAGLNNEDIDGVNASNTGVVKATGGGAGGIFAENTGNITNSILTNNKIVVGTGTGITGATGGIIGKNSGNISTSSLKNEIGAQVIGTHNVGGLIGYNTGTIVGGRDAADSYYKYQIYNNGVINVGTWDDKNGDKLVDAGEITLSGITGQNIGGLIGKNGKTGNLTAGYNTGAINAGNSENVGGIAGTNEGTLDQVFSTIFDADGNVGKVTGGTNVGGLVGNNSGTLSNAYNTSGVAVTGNSSFGTLVGMNNGTVANAYTTVGNQFFGSGSSNTSVTNVYFADASDSKWKDHNSYGGFDFDTDGSGIWKNYDGYGNPLLKVFLTKAYYNPSTGQLVSAADGFEAHYNADGGLIFPGGMNNFWSTQIGFDKDKGNPNWLGYDLIPFVSDENWDFLYDDAPFGPFDRNRDFRERKAEINFVDGGMEI